MIRLEGLFERELDKAQRQIDQLTKELNYARGRIDDLEQREIERLSHYKYNKEVVAENNNQSMMQQITTGDNNLLYVSFIILSI